MRHRRSSMDRRERGTQTRLGNLAKALKRAWVPAEEQQNYGKSWRKTKKFFAFCRRLLRDGNDLDVRALKFQRRRLSIISESSGEPQG